ncbi:MAG: DUF3047 domain-containing protein [Candidatus Binatia bacterium]
MMVRGAWLLATLAATLCFRPGPSALASEQGRVLFQEDFEAGISDRWVERGFPSIERKNTFSLATDPVGNHYLKVESAQSASGRGVHLRFSPRACSDVSWRWMVSHAIATADITRREGDDGAAKLYVVFDGPSLWNPFDKRVIVYVWDNAAPVGRVFHNAWLPEKERMLVLESGNEKAGRWVTERVHLAQDFGRAFPGERPGEVEALAFMADTDNTATQVSAGLDDLVIRCRAPEQRH